MYEIIKDTFKIEVGKYYTNEFDNKLYKVKSYNEKFNCFYANLLK